MDSRASYILVAGLSPAVADSLPTYPQDQQAIDEFRGLKVPPGSAVAPGLVTVSVVDGTGTTGQATTTAAQFSSLGFHVVGTGSATSIGPISETVVYMLQGTSARRRTATTADAAATTVPLASASTAELTSASTLGQPSPAVQPLPCYDPEGLSLRVREWP